MSSKQIFLQITYNPPPHIIEDPPIIQDLPVENDVKFTLEDPGRVKTLRLNLLNFCETRTVEYHWNRLEQGIMTFY